MNENKSNEIIVKSKTSKVVIALLIISIIMVIFLSGYIVYCKTITNDGVKTNEEKVSEKNGISTNEEKVPEKEEIKQLNGNTYYRSLNNDQYFKFISDTEYEYSIFDNTELIKSKGKYTYDGKNIELSDEKIDVVLDDDLLFVHNKEYQYNEEDEFYEIYFNKNTIIDEFSNIGKAAATTRINEWNSDNTTKMTSTEGNTSFCYGYDTNSNKISCYVTIKQYFDNYDQNTCQNDPTSDFQKSVISSGTCEYAYSDNSYFTSIERSSNGYKATGSWTGI